jgi:hypothetical protein
LERGEFGGETCSNDEHEDLAKTIISNLGVKLGKRAHPLTDQGRMKSRALVK